jgi:hypothetical protein
MQKDENNHLIYQKFLKSEIKKPNSLNFVEIKPSIEPNPSKTDASN